MIGFPIGIAHAADPEGSSTSSNTRPAAPPRDEVAYLEAHGTRASLAELGPDVALAHDALKRLHHEAEQKLETVRGIPASGRDAIEASKAALLAWARELPVRLADAETNLALSLYPHLEMASTQGVRDAEALGLLRQRRSELVSQYVRLRQEEFETSINPYGGSSPQEDAPRQQILQKMRGVANEIADIEQQIAETDGTARSQGRRNLVKRLRQLEERRGTEGRVDPRREANLDPADAPAAAPSDVDGEMEELRAAIAQKTGVPYPGPGELFYHWRVAQRERLLSEFSVKLRECTAHLSPLGVMGALAEDFAGQLMSILQFSFREPLEPDLSVLRPLYEAF